MSQEENIVELYKNWDKELSKKQCDYDKLEREMLSAWMYYQNDPEIMWRLASINYNKSLNMIDDDEIKAKTIDSLKYAEKSIKCFESAKKDNFQADKWMAIINGKLALLETDLELKIKYTENFLKFMDKCLSKNPNDQMVLFMQGRYQLALIFLNEEEEKLLKERLSNIPKLDLDDAIMKLQKSIELKPDFIDNYITMAYLLIKIGRLNEAKEVIEKGLNVHCYTKSDELIQKELMKIKNTLQ